MNQRTKTPMTERQLTGGPGAGASADDAPKGIAQMEGDLDQTRNAISGDLRTLGERLSPEHLKEEAREVLAEAKSAAVETLHEAKDVATSAFKEAKDSAMESVSNKIGELRDDVRRAERQTLGFLRENAVPLGLMGVGLAWFISKRRSREQHWNDQYGGRWSEAEGSQPGAPRHAAAREPGSARSRSRSAEPAGAQPKVQAGRWLEKAGSDVGDAAGQVRGFAARELRDVQQTARNVRHKVGDAAHRAVDFAGQELREAQDFSRHASETHPLAVGAVAVAAGLSIGLLLPSTRREERLLGAGRERLVSEAKDAVQDWTQTAKDTARDVSQAITGA